MADKVNVFRIILNLTEDIEQMSSLFTDPSSVCNRAANREANSIPKNSRFWDIKYSRSFILLLSLDASFFSINNFSYSLTLTKKKVELTSGMESRILSRVDEGSILAGIPSYIMNIIIFHRQSPKEDNYNKNILLMIWRQMEKENRFQHSNAEIVHAKMRNVNIVKMRLLLTYIIEFN